MKQNYNNKAKHRSAWFALVLLMLTALPITAQNAVTRFQVGQLWYEVVDATNHTVKVTYANTNAAKSEARQQVFEADYLNNGDKGADTNADNTYKGYSGTLKGTITIPETVKDDAGTQWKVVAIGTCAFINERGFYDNNSEKKVQLNFNLPPTIKHIEEAAFYQAYACAINFPEGLETIGRQAFYKSIVGYYFIYSRPKIRRGGGPRAKSTGTITIPGQTAIGPQAFEECSTRGATLSCPNIRYLGYQAFKKSGLTIKDPVSAKLGEQPTDPKIIAMYANLPGVDMESGAEAFSQYNKGVVTLKEGITTIPKGMFENAFKDLAKFVIPSTVTTIEERAFANAGIKSFNELSTVTKIGARAFENGALSGDFVIRDNVEEIGDGAFKGNTNLTGFTLIGSANCKVGAGILEGCPLEYLDLRNVNSPDVKNHLTNLSREANSGTGSTKTLVAGLPANVIVYLPDVPNISFADGQDVNFVKSNGECTKLLLVDGVEYEFPYEIKASEVVYDRDISSFASGKNCFTIFLPYAVTLPTGIRAYNLKSVGTKKVWNDFGQKFLDQELYMFKSIPDGSILDANRAYLLRITDGQVHRSQEFKATGKPVTIAASGNDKDNFIGRIRPMRYVEGEPDKSFVFTGSTECLSRWTTEIDKVNNPWTLGRDRTTGEDLWKRALSNKGRKQENFIPPFRGVILPKTVVTSVYDAKQFVLLDEDNQTTGIGDVTKDADAQQGAQRIYTIDGRYVGTNLDSLPSGMYIMKGKKTLKTK